MEGGRASQEQDGVYREESGPGNPYGRTTGVSGMRVASETSSPIEVLWHQSASEGFSHYLWLRQLHCLVRHFEESRKARLSIVGDLDASSRLHLLEITKF